MYYEMAPDEPIDDSLDDSTTDDILDDEEGITVGIVGLDADDLEEEEKDKDIVDDPEVEE